MNETPTTWLAEQLPALSEDEARAAALAVLRARDEARDVELLRALDPLGAYQSAVRLRTALERTSRVRWLKRRRLELDLAAACRRADLAARILGAGPNARPLREILDAAIAERGA